VFLINCKCDHYPSDSPCSTLTGNRDLSWCGMANRQESFLGYCWWLLFCLSL